MSTTSPALATAQTTPDTLGSPLETLRFRDILALRRGSNLVAFHADTMDVASLAPEAWPALLALKNPESAPALSIEQTEAREELESWAGEKPAGHQTDHAATVRPLLREPTIRSLTINVSQICNLACTYCAAGGDGTYGSKTKTPDLESTQSLLTRLISTLPAGEIFVITFLGGEPLLHPEIVKSLARHAQLMAAGRNIRLDFDIVTNGTLITPEAAELLASLHANVTISIDGAPEDNDRARVTKSGRGSSHMILKGLAELVKVRERLGSLTAGAVFGTHNLNVVKAWEFLSSYPFDSIKFDFAAEANDEQASREFAKQVAKVADLAAAKGGERELRRLQTFDHLFRALDDKARIQNHCLAGKNHMQLDTSGKLTACQWFVGQKNEEFGSLKDLDLSLNNPVLKGFAEPLIEKNGCGTCWARHICGGGCMHVNKVKNGNKHKVDQAFCERTRTIIAKGIERYAESRYDNPRRNIGDASEVH